MSHLGDLVPGEPCRVIDRLLHRGLRGTVGNHIKPVAIAAVFRHTPFVGREQDRARGTSQTFNLVGKWVKSALDLW